MDNQKSIEQKCELYENEIKRVNEYYDRMVEELDRVIWEQSDPVRTDLLIKKLRKSRKTLSQCKNNTYYQVNDSKNYKK